MKFLKDYFKENYRLYELSNAFNEWDEVEQETYVRVIKDFLDDLGQKKTLKKIYKIACEKLQHEKDAFVDFLVYDVECFIKQTQGSFIWVVFDYGATALIDLQSLLFTHKGDWSPLMHFESLLGGGGRRDYYLMDKEEGFLKMTEEMCFDYLYDGEKKARNALLETNETKRVNAINKVWKKDCEAILKPTRFEKKRVRLANELPKMVKSNSVESSHGEVVEVENIQFEEQGVTSFVPPTRIENPFEFRKERTSSLFEMDESYFDELLQTKLVCNTSGQVRFSFAVDELV